MAAIPDRVLLVTDDDLFPRALRYVRAHDAEPQHVDGLEARVGNWGRVQVAVVRTDEPAHAVRTLADAGVDVALLVGTGLGMNPLLLPGTLVVVEEAVTTDGAWPSTERLKEGVEAGLGSEFCRWQCGGAASAPENATPELLLDLRQRGAHVLATAAGGFLEAAQECHVAGAAIFLVGDELARFARLDEEAPGGLVWERREADPKDLEGPGGALLRGAYSALTGYGPEEEDAA